MDDSSKKSIAPANFKFNKDEINLNACLSNNNGAKDETAKYVESSITCPITSRTNFKEWRECAFVASSSETTRFQSGSTTYKDPKFPKPLNLNDNMLSKDLQQSADTRNRDPTLSKSCSATRYNIDKLAAKMAEISISTTRDNKELSLEDLRQTLYSIFRDELLNHADGHAASSSISDTLDCTSKRIDSNGMEGNTKECKFLRKYIEKIAKKKYSVSFDINGATAIDRILKEIVDRILEDTRNFVVNKDLQKPAVSKDVMYEVVQKLLSPEKFQLACSYAQRKFMQYSCGMLKYEKNRPVDGIELEPVETDEVKFTTEDVLTNYKNAVVCLMIIRYHCYPTKGFLPMMNNTLNDIGVLFADMCCESARRNDNILSENDVFAALNTLLPERLRNNVFTRFVREGRECPPRNNQTSSITGIQIVPVPVETDEVEITPKDVLPDYAKTVQTLMMKEYHCKWDKRILPMMNNTLNDIGVLFAEMCCESARRNDNILSENDVFSAVNTLLPERLRNNVFKRIVREGRECPRRNNQVPDHSKAVQSLMVNEYHCEPDKRFLPMMNNTLNEATQKIQFQKDRMLKMEMECQGRKNTPLVRASARSRTELDLAFERLRTKAKICAPMEPQYIGVALKEMCSESALGNGNVLSENDVLAAVNILVRERLRNNDFTRIVHYGRECKSRKNKVKVSKRRNRSKSSKAPRVPKDQIAPKRSSGKKRRRRRRNRHRKNRSDASKPTNADA